MRAELRFGPDATPERRRAVATAFWGLLASDPTALASYCDRSAAPEDDDWLCYRDNSGYSGTRGPALTGYWGGRFHGWVLPPRACDICRRATTN